MIKYLELTAPDTGAFRQAKILSIECKEGDRIKKGTTLFRVKSNDKQLNLPSTMEGRVVEMIATVGENITLSSALLLLETEIEGRTATPSMTHNEPLLSTTRSVKQTNGNGPQKDRKIANKSKRKKSHKKIKQYPQQMLILSDEDKSDDIVDTTITSNAATNEPIAVTSEPMPSSNPAIKINVPDIGTSSAKVIDILVNVGDHVSAEDPLITLESDKASMDVPSTHNGVISAITVLVEQDVSEGTLILELTPDVNNANDLMPSVNAGSTPDIRGCSDNKINAGGTEPTQPAPQATPPAGKSHASPSIRRLARELGVDLSKVSGSGRKNRITKDDVKEFAKNIITNNAAGVQTANEGFGIPSIPAQDFNKYGATEVQPLNKIKRLTATNLHRAWLNVPHVTHHDESNISDLESFRKQLNSEYAEQKKDIKLSPLAFVLKALVNAMQAYPQFNSSLEPSGENLILKKYFNIGVAVDTPNGLVVPVVKDVDKKSITDIARDMGNLATKARNKKLTINDMSGACITVSSLGGIGGTHFTPIVNAPEVAILGVSRSTMRPIWNGSEFVPGMILPLSLSYDHRVIDGAEAARFTHHIAEALEDIRRLTV